MRVLENFDIFSLKVQHGFKFMEELNIKFLNFIKFFKKFGLIKIFSGFLEMYRL